MGDTVKSIFMTLIKVPIIIAVVFFCLDVFAFATSYFRLLGVSYTLQNVVMENNFIPDSELASLENYLSTLETSMLRDIEIVNRGAVTGLGSRQQYGREVETGITAKFTWAVPFMPIKNKAKTGSVLDTTGGPNTLYQYTNDPEHGTSGGSPIANGITVPITITFTVPGMKYYPDLSF